MVPTYIPAVFLQHPEEQFTNYSPQTKSRLPPVFAWTAS